MHRLKALAFLLVFAVPAQMPLAAWLLSRAPDAQWLTWWPLFFLFVLLPATDYSLGHDAANVPAEREREVALQPWFRALTLLALPVQLALLAWSGAWFVQAELGWFGNIGWLLSQGVVGGVLAINTAHELIHKDGRLEPLFGGLLLSSVGYHGFKVEHLRGHHVHVSTPEDASSARLGQSVWHFLPRAMWRNTLNAWSLEALRLRKLGHSPLSWRNELMWWTAAWLALAAAFFFALDGKGLLFFLAQGVIAAGTLEVINYIEHYGLERQRLADGRYERTTHLHSWNSDYALSNLLLFQLQRHSDHHAFPKRRYSILRHHADSPQLPGGYAAMFVLALFPPLWRRVIDPRVLRFRAEAHSA
ncbi:alkane 1-monooxygenase [Arenimonas sp.]|uniref:alkane 1-monooxygenase n=1 Tax=Arenimonas sp. TaxID=1872635 RepID=UPI0039E2A001